MSAILDLARTRPVLFDGAIGTELMKRGFPQGSCPELSNLEYGDLVRAVHGDYFAAGSDAVTTNSLGGSRIKLDAAGLAGRCRELNRAAAEHVAAVRPAGGFVAGSVGATGAFLKPEGEYTEKDFEESYAEQIAGLAEGGSDLVIIETMFDLRETLCALAASRRAAPQLPVFVTMTYNKTPRGFFTMMGDRLADCVAALERGGAEVIGANCTLMSADMIELAAALRAATRRPILIQPNAGQPKVDAEGRLSYAQTAEEFAADMVRIEAAGVRFLGGCCGTTPETIRCLARALGRA